MVFPRDQPEFLALTLARGVFVLQIAFTDFANQVPAGGPTA
jgi:hypothetical protein